MIKTSSGYVFECKKDVNGIVGVRECFTSTGYCGKRNVNAIFGIDGNFNIMSPAFCTVSNGFRSLSAEIGNSIGTEVLDSFLKSNRATYSLLPYVQLICMVKGSLDPNTLQFSKSAVTFYVPRAMTKLDSQAFQNEKLLEDYGVLCEKATSDTKELNTFYVEPVVLNMIEHRIVQKIATRVASKKDFLASRII